MKRCRLYLLVAVALLLVAFSFAACGKSGGGGTTAPGTTTPSEYTVTFSVNGVDTAVTVAAGAVPSFDGSTEKAPDINGKKYYHFTGWDKPLSAATENVTYTAQYEELTLCTVMWDVQGGIQKSYIGEGMVPTPPDGATDVKLTNDLVRTFVRWDKTIGAATTGVNLYKAVYSDETRYYTVTFKVNGTEVATGRSEYNKLAYRAYAGGAKLPAGYGDIMWIDGNVKVTDDTVVVNGLYVAQNGQSLSLAYTTDLIDYVPSQSENSTYYNSTSAVLYMLYEIRTTKNPDATTELLIDRCVKSLQSMVNGENAAPNFDLSATWYYVPLSGAILMAKETPAVWNKLTVSDKEQLDFIMEALAYVLTLGTDDDNHYETGPGMMGNYNKTWNPNYRLANVIPMLFIGKYFGGAANVNTMLHAFSYDAVVAKFEEYGFTRAYENWTKPNPIDPTTGATLPGTKTFMENGGPAYTKKRDDSTGDRLNITEGKAAGSGVGVRTDYTYGGYNIDNIAAIIGKLFDYNYSGGTVVSSKDNDADGKADAYILDGTKSPYEGLEGMMKEFNSGNRSSASYCMDDFLMVITTLFVLEELDLYDLTSDVPRLHKVWVGNQDFLYKYAHGYRSTSGYNTVNDHYESGAAAHYYIWKEVWMSGLGKLKHEELPAIPEPFNPVLGSEDFSETVLDLVEATEKVGNFTFGNGKRATAMKTVVGDDGNTYLLVTQGTNAKDTLINLSADGGLAKAMGEYKVLTISFDLARQTGVSTPVTELRLRQSSSLTRTIMNTGSNGEIKMMGNLLTTLTEAFQTVKLRIDFATGTVTGYVNGVEKATATLSVPSGTTATTTEEWLSTITTYVFNWYISNKSDRALLLDNISAIVEVPAEPDSAE